MTCPDDTVCEWCPCAHEDDVCFPGERLRAERDRYHDAIVDALADLTPGIAPYGVLADALDPERRKEASS